MTHAAASNGRVLEKRFTPVSPLREKAHSWRPLHAFFQAERVQDIQRKCAKEVVATADSRLGQHAVRPTFAYLVVSRQPRVVEQAGGEGSGIHRHLRPEFTLSPVIRHKVSRYSVACATPKSVASAKVISRLIPEQSIPSGNQAVLHYKLSVPGRVASPIASKPASPIVRFTAGLVNSGRKGPGHVRSSG